MDERIHDLSSDLDLNRPKSVDDEDLQRHRLLEAWLERNKPEMCPTRVLQGAKTFSKWTKQRRGEIIANKRRRGGTDCYSKRDLTWSEPEGSFTPWWIRV
tara:strand:- start:7393 stop:7692 length:300 start_codon:yes stop_codon:yes gene_type:complete